MSLPTRLYKFGSTSFLDITRRFSTTVHEKLGWEAVPLGKDYNIVPLWSMWVTKEEAEKAEKWFAKAYPKNFYSDINYNGISECRQWTVKDSVAFHNLLLEKFPRGPQYDLRVKELLEEGLITRTHSKVYYIMLTRK